MATRIKYLTDSLLIDSIYGDYKTLADAVANIGAFKNITLGSETHTISGNITIPSNVSINFQRGAKISGAYTITFSSNKIIADSDIQIFDTNVLFAGTLNVGKIYPQWWGAKGDAVTDDYLAVSKAISFMSSFGGEVVFPTGHYILGTQIVNNLFTKGKNCIISGEGSVILDSSTKSAETIMLDLGCAQDAFEDGVSLTANATRGSKSIACPIEVVKGDVIQIFSTDSWGGIQPFYKRELACVSSYSAGTIYLDKGIYDDYSAATTVVVKMNSSLFKFNNITMVGNTSVNQTGLTVRNFRNIKITENDISNFQYSNLVIAGVYGGTINNSRIYNSTMDGFGYGISVSVCQDVNIYNNEITDCRHTIMMGSASRSIDVYSNHVSTIYGHRSPLDNHESCEYVTFRDNFIWGGGILLRGLNNNVLNNTLYNTEGGSGIKIQIYGYPNRVNNSVNITGNRIIPAGGTLMHGIEVSFDNSGDTIDKIMIANNTFESDLSSVYIHADVGTTNNLLNNLVFDSNHFIVSGDAPVIQMAAIGEITYNNVIFNGGRMVSPSYGLSITAKSGSKNIYLNDVVIEATSNLPINVTDKFLNLFVKNCHIKSGSYINASCTGNVTLQNNTFEDMIKGGIKINSGVGVYTHGGNVKINCTGVVENDATLTNDGVDY